MRSICTGRWEVVLPGRRSSNQNLASLAGETAEAFTLRECDSVQLEAARRRHQSIKGEMTFACFDKRFLKVASMMGMQVLDFT